MKDKSQWSDKFKVLKETVSIGNSTYLAKLSLKVKCKQKHFQKKIERTCCQQTSLTPKKKQQEIPKLKENDNCW